MSTISIIVDTREQQPYSFDPDKVQSIRRALPAGDYSIEGFEDSVAVERKSLEDYVSTVIRGRRRFYKELARLADYDSACVVVEAELRQILLGNYQCGAHPYAIFGATISIIMDFGVPVYFCSDRQVACRFVEEFLVRFHRKMVAP
ncbi:MAG: hypothetical protein GY854_21685 [Deltaproteobacteria bacterium]|nr:hypothetical protein [Deltaproteobacteria bacterium]